MIYAIYNKMTKKRTFIFTMTLLIIVAIFVSVWFVSISRYGATVPFVADEKLIIPKTESIVASTARTVGSGAVATPINPDRGMVSSSLKALTLKSGYDVAYKEAYLWSQDAALVFEKSISAVTTEGKSGEWQVVFGSKAKKTGLEVIVYGDTVAIKREVKSTEYGSALPQNWYDSGDALSSLRTLPQFTDATVSSISFYYNVDGRAWGYALATSKGTVSMPVK